jgi:hypothetical protein
MASTSSSRRCGRINFGRRLEPGIVDAGGKILLVGNGKREQAIEMADQLLDRTYGDHGSLRRVQHRGLTSLKRIPVATVHQSLRSGAFSPGMLGRRVRGSRTRSLLWVSTAAVPHRGPVG